MKIYQSRLFERKVKKMTKAEKEALDREVKNIAENPSLGEEKSTRRFDLCWCKRTMRYGN